MNNLSLIITNSLQMKLPQIIHDISVCLFECADSQPAVGVHG